MLKTKHKIALARIVWNGVRVWKRVLGEDMIAECARRGIKWRLDLNEGIDFSIFLLGGFELPTLRFYSKAIRPGETVLDIGANIGAHTLPLAKCVGPSGSVHAFEATEFAFNKLLANAALNPSLSPIIQCNHMLLSSSAEDAAPSQIYSSWPLNPTGEVHEKHLGQLRPVGTAPVVSLDSYLARAGVQRIDWIKIDVDGNEYPVLCGAQSSLARFRPKIIMEMSPYVCRELGYDFDKLVDLIADSGYEVFDFESGRKLPSNGAELDAMVPDGAGFNVFLKPVMYEPA